MFKLLKNQKGSTLMMIVIMTAVLTVLGTAVISMSIMNTTMKYNDYRAKRNMYNAESAIDEAYAIVANKVREKLVLSTTETQKFMDELKATLDATVIEGGDETTFGVMPLSYLFDMTDDVTHYGYTVAFAESGSADTLLISRISATEINTYTVTTTNYNDTFYLEDLYNNIKTEDKMLIENKIKAISDEMYRFIFKIEFNNIDKQNEFITAIEEIPGTSTTLDVDIVGDVINEFSTPADFVDDKYVIKSVTSTFLENNIERKVTADIVVTAPKDVYPLIIEENIYSVENNPLWQNALVSNKDIIFNDNTNIKGDVYALGEYEAVGGKQVYQTHGIKINSLVDVEGDMVSGCYIQTAGSGTSLTVNRGQVYANSLVTAKDADASIIQVNEGNVYTEDDLEINAENSQIEIIGSYYGLSNGESEHNTSSSIIINAMLKTAATPGAKLKITGDLPDLPNPKFNEIIDLVEFNGVWIPGTAYIDIDPYDDPDDEGDNGVYDAYFPFQTGESLSIKGNYWAYATTMDLGLGNNFDDDAIDKVKGLVEGMTEPIDFISKYLIKDDNPIDGEPDDFTVQDKKDYFMRVYDYTKVSNPFMEAGTSTSIDIDNFKYVLGVKVIEITEDTYTFDDNYTEDDRQDFIRLNKIQLNDYHHYLNYTINTETNNEIEQGDSGSIVKPLSSYNIINNPDLTTISTDIAFSTIDILNSVESVRNSSIQATQRIYVTKEQDDIQIVASGAIASSPYDVLISPDFAANNKYFQGVIITQGNVVIDGSINFTGTIIAGGTITINGDNNEFYNNDNKSVNYMIKLIRENSALRKVFNTADYVELVSKPTISYAEASEISADNNSNIEVIYDQLIDIKNWKLD